MHFFLLICWFNCFIVHNSTLAQLRKRSGVDWEEMSIENTPWLRFESNTLACVHGPNQSIVSWQYQLCKNLEAIECQVASNGGERIHIVSTHKHKKCQFIQLPQPLQTPTPTSTPPTTMMVHLNKQYTTVPFGIEDNKLYHHQTKLIIMTCTVDHKVDTLAVVLYGSIGYFLRWQLRWIEIYKTNSSLLKAKHFFAETRTLKQLCHFVVLWL